MYRVMEENCFKYGLSPETVSEFLRNKDPESPVVSECYEATRDVYAERDALYNNEDTLDCFNYPYVLKYVGIEFAEFKNHIVEVLLEQGLIEERRAYDF